MSNLKSNAKSKRWSISDSGLDLYLEFFFILKRRAYNIISQVSALGVALGMKTLGSSPWRWPRERVETGWVEIGFWNSKKNSELRKLTLSRIKLCFLFFHFNERKFYFSDSISKKSKTVPWQKPRLRITFFLTLRKTQIWHFYEKKRKREKLRKRTFKLFFEVFIGK